MWNEPTIKQLSEIPGLYETQEIPPMNRVIHMHFFFGRYDWYIAEYDGKDSFFAYTILNRDMENAVWGYISYKELKELNKNGVEITRDINWKPKKASEIPEIQA